MGWSHGTEWTDSLIAEFLTKQVMDLGRMPSATELRKCGLNDLACVISRRGGYREWAVRLRTVLKGTETHRGQKWERYEAAFFRALDFLVEEQRTKAPYDLLINGHRVDVKSSTYCEYGDVRGYLFNGLKRGRDCDFFDLVCVEEDVVVHRFIVPASLATMSLTITRSSYSTPSSGGKWAAYKDAICLLLGGDR